MQRPPREAATTQFDVASSDRPQRQIPLNSPDEKKLSDFDLASTPSLHQQVSFLPSQHVYSRQNDMPTTSVQRNKSLVKPERQRLDVDSPLYAYRAHAADFATAGGRTKPSNTGSAPQALFEEQQPRLRRGVSILDRQQPGESIVKRANTIRKARGRVLKTEDLKDPATRRGPLSPWLLYSQLITCCIPPALLRCFGLYTKERQRAWREKVALLAIVFSLMAAVGFLTFGFTQTVCGKEPLRFNTGTVASGSMIFHGYDYSMDKFEHPGAPNIVENSNPLYQGFNTGGLDGSFYFQKVNQKCLDIITPAAGTGIQHEGNFMAWYFPCNLFNQYGTTGPNLTGYADGTMCHTSSTARNMFAESESQSVRGMKREGPVYFRWDQIRNESRNLGVYQQNVLDFGLLRWLDRTQVNMPEFFTSLGAGNESYRGQDITMQVLRDKQRDLADCLVDIIRVGTIDSKSIGCVASDVVLYASLVVIIGVVVIKFAMAVIFGWFISWRLGNYKRETRKQQRQRADEIENWSADIFSPAPARYRPNVKKSMLPTKSRFSTYALKQPTSNPNRFSTYNNYSRSTVNSNPTKPVGSAMRNSPPGSPGGLRVSPSSTSLSTPIKDSRRSSLSLESLSGSPTCPWPLHNVVPQPPASYEPFNFPLIQTICLVTAYSESVEGLRTTLDSLATTDYPNSHKLILIVADGMVKGSGNKLTTPEIVLGMMKEFVTPPEEVEPNSYVAIADGHKRHNMAKVFAGFYSYDDRTVEPGKQQRVPVVLVAKVGNPLESSDAKPGNRGKRDSQVLVMSFLQKVMFDERMTTLEYEFFNAIWRCTGVTADQYQVCLMVDADTKVFPDSLTRMVACMVDDPEIMGLCGETKIANKTETWVTMIQVFEYYLAHHQTKAFEAMFGGVTCLPGCFSMYRIKAPKGPDGYWVPIIANPDIVEHYSENVVDTLHKKNLLLLGEDRYLSTLMLKTFPRRKMMFCPQAVCKTVVPDTFRVLLSQRRRWINSTVHNLFELLFVRDLCGTFCFSMQFVVFMDLVGTLVLPAAIAFTMYLLIITCIPSMPKPTVSLILLAIILGLPGVLIVITSRKIVYVGWMLIYLCSLPIWNFVLPFYSYLHMDDFTWGQTRKVQGDKGGHHGDKEGEFDSSHIVMKRWAEFERERRWRTARRESSYEVMARAASPSAEGRRYSATSSSENGYPIPAEQVNLRHASQPLYAQHTQLDDVPPPSRAIYPVQLELPAPLAPGLRSSTNSSPTLTDPAVYTSSSTASSSRHITHSPPMMASREHSQPSYMDEGSDAERQAMLASSPEVSGLPSSPTSPHASMAPYSDWGPTPDEQPVDSQQLPTINSRSSIASRYTGVSLRDDGPVAGEGGFRAVQRTRRSSHNRNSTFFDTSPPPPPAPRSRASLPPGARPT